VPDHLRVSFQIRAFEDELVDSAARLLAATYATTRVGEDAPAIDLADETDARAAIVACSGSGPGVAAVRDGVLVGFLTSTVMPAPGRNVAAISQQQHAASNAPRDVYRAMYTALSADLVTRGCLTHLVRVPVADPEVVRTWFELGFGVDQIKGVRPVAPRQPVTYRVADVSPAEPGDVDALSDLRVELQEFHEGAPMFQHAVADRAAIRRDLESTLADTRSGVWVARDGERVVGMMEVGPDGRYTGVATIGVAITTQIARGRGIGTQILDRVLAWAHERAYTRCAVGWTSANPVSDAFWRGHGFRPLRYRLARELDDRVAPAQA
jgi:GNAT superfamily N-acetyltransferase